MKNQVETAALKTGPAILSLGFRPFFLGAAVWAVLAMVLWVSMLKGAVALPTAFDPVSWHAHEFLFGYLGAVVAGFLLTAVPNWTGRPPVSGWWLGALAGLWLAGRIVIAVSAQVPALLVAGIDLAFPLALAGVIGCEVVAAKNWRNLIVLGLLGVFAAGNALFHWEAGQALYAAQGAGLRLGLGAGIMMIAVIGGRIVPAFTRNWLVKHGATTLPALPMQRFDKLALLVLLVALLLWVGLPEHPLTGAALLISGTLHAVRLARWSGSHTLTEPLVAVLHVGYAFLPLGAFTLGVEILAPGLLGIGAAQHFWMAGAIGLMTMAVMTRATLGHSGQALRAGPGTVAIYVLIVMAVIARVAGGVWSEQAPFLHLVSGAFWIGAFGGFAAIYGRALLGRRA